MSERGDATRYVRLTLSKGKVEHSPSETGLAVNEPGNQVE